MDRVQVIELIKTNFQPTGILQNECMQHIFDELLRPACKCVVSECSVCVSMCICDVSTCLCVCTHCMCITNPCSVMALGHVLPCNCFEERVPEACHCSHTSSPTQKCLWGSFVALPLSPLHYPYSP